ncbi:MAG: cisplatin damage response ATP-dependent DNA ligase [Rhodospirillaceae bacterium]|nr:cisplatin damage response ATP-dependent DNA ligase [Rhodospirillaceae bacterium]
MSVTAFALLIERLAFMPSRTGKLRLLEDHFRQAEDPDRGWALAALTGALSFPAVKAGAIRAAAAARLDPVLFAASYDFVGDLAETVALMWPDTGVSATAPSLAEAVERLTLSGRAEAPALLAAWLDRLDDSARVAFLKLVTGGLRVGVSARLAKTALARFGGRAPEEIEEVWHGLAPPYRDLFAWLDGRAGRPQVNHAATFRPLMLATPLEDTEAAALDLSAYAAEWKWDGIRVQLVAGADVRRIFSRTGDDITPAFPDIARHMAFDAVLDGELLVARPGAEAGSGSGSGSGSNGAAAEIAPFNDLQQRLNRKTVTRRMLAEHPAWVRLYDILFEAGEDLRGLAFTDRRARLEAWFARIRPQCMDLSPLVAFAGLEELAALRRGARGRAIEGLMLKRRDSAYVGGRPKGPWFKWKRGPLTLDTVLMYAQRGHGKRSSYYSDFTFGAWREVAGGGRELVPVGKAYFGFTDAELVDLDRWVRTHTTDRFGPVRAVEPRLVLEVAFDSVHRSSRHKSGVAMRFPRVHRIRWDKPAEDADALATLEAMIAE